MLMLAKTHRTAGARHTKEERSRDAAREAAVVVAALQHDTILETVRSCLKSSSYAPLRLLTCESENGTLVLYGWLPSYFLKQVAQELVRGPAAARPLYNAITVTNGETD